MITSKTGQDITRASDTMSAVTFRLLPHLCIYDSIKKGVMNVEDVIQYYLVNKALNMPREKQDAQVAHCASRYERSLRDIPLEELSEDYRIWSEGIEKKIIVYASLSKLEELVAEGYIHVRDVGINHLEPNTLTCVVLPPMNKENSPKWLKRLRTTNSLHSSHGGG